MLPAYGLWGYLSAAALRQSFVAARMMRRQAAAQITKAEVSAMLADTLPKRPKGQLVWFHAPTATEISELNEVKLTLQEYLPDLEFLITTEVESDQIAEMMPDAIIQQLPLDYPRFARRFIKGWSPDAGIWMSDTIYPALLSRVAREGIPVIYANAGMSRTKAYKYSWIPSYVSSYFKCFSRILVRSDSSARRLRWLRVPRRKIEVVGKLSAGAVALPYEEERRAQFLSQLQNRTVWFSAHTELSEIATLAKVQRRMSRSAQRALLILHLADENAEENARTRLEAVGLKVSAAADTYPKSQTDVFLVKGAEELGLYYRLSPVRFIGGTLTHTGGNDPFEAAALGSAILHGPYTESFQNAYDRLEDAGATKKIMDSETMFRALISAIAPDEAARMAHAAWEVSSSSARVTDRVLELLAEHLNFGLMEFEVESDEAA